MSTGRGVIAAGHPETAAAGAWALGEGGNAVDAAVCAVLASFVAESPLTGFGAGGFMLVHDSGGENALLDFFVAAPGKGGVAPAAELIPVPVYFDETPQIFNVGPASCGVPGTAAGLAAALERFGSAPLADLAGPAIRLAREGVSVNAEQAYIFEILAPIFMRSEGTRELYAPRGKVLGEGETFRIPELAETLQRYGEEGPEPFYRGETAHRIAEFVTGEGGALTPDDLAAYEVIERSPVGADFRDTHVLTNAPPSSGGVLIAYCLGTLERLGERSGVEEIIAAMDAANSARGEEFATGLYEEGFGELFLDPERLELDAERQRHGTILGDASGGLGSTTHISVLDGEGMCANVTCSNGSCSGVMVPGTGIQLNNMLGEEDLNPLGFGMIESGRRGPSMMAPTVVLRDGEIVLGLGSAGSNRIRSAIVQTIIRSVEQEMRPQQAIDAARLHFEDGTVQAEPGIDEEALSRLEARGLPVARWQRQNLYFGGVQAVARDPASGELSGGGDPRRGGTAVVV
ncbi:MAG: gamma-glutamyltransferase family protein [Solirubrobacterales bacterium]